MANEGILSILKKKVKGQGPFELTIDYLGWCLFILRDYKRIELIE